MTCEHDFNKENTTVDLLKKRFMVNPQILYGKCRCCSCIFSYTINTDGLFVKEESDEDKQGNLRSAE